MKAMILAAGEDRKLHPLTLTCPKPMLPVGDRPLLERNILLLRAYGIREIAINLREFPEIIMDYFGNGEKWGVSLYYSYEETLLGSAGAVKKMEPFFDETFVVMYGDLFTFIDLQPMITYHQNLKAQVTIAIHEISNPCDKGIIQLNEQGWITRFMEKPRPHQVFSTLGNTGVYLMEPEVLRWIPPQTVCDFGHHIFPWLINNQKRLAGYPTNEFLIDIGTLSSYKQAQQWAISKYDNQLSSPSVAIET
jgi:mannose-1-phosphate guanylyltransferase/phosphomannomutase